MTPRRSARLAMKPRVNFREPSLRIAKAGRATTKKYRVTYPNTCSNILIGINYIILFAVSVSLCSPFIVHMSHI
jgi:hypothetical protein